MADRDVLPSLAAPSEEGVRRRDIAAGGRGERVESEAEERPPLTACPLTIPPLGGELDGWGAPLAIPVQMIGGEGVQEGREMWLRSEGG